MYLRRDYKLELSNVFILRVFMILNRKFFFVMFKCFFCLFVFSWKLELDRYFKKYKDDKLFLCNYCNY